MSAAFDEAEAQVRIAMAYGSVLVARLALARTQEPCRRVSGVSAGALARAAVAATALVDAMDVVLEHVSPELASHAAAVADIACARDMPPRRAAAESPGLRLVDGPPRR